MTAYDKEANEKKLKMASADISRGNISDKGWLGFLGALGWMENSGSYAVQRLKNGQPKNPNFHGIYQVGHGSLQDLNFLSSNGVGGGFLGVTSIASLNDNPLAQELSGLMLFCGIPDVANKAFSSRYTATLKAANSLSGFSIEKFGALIDKSFVLQFKDSSGKVIATTGEIKFSKAAISAAAHLVGQGSVAKAMATATPMTTPRWAAARPKAKSLTPTPMARPTAPTP